MSRGNAGGGWPARIAGRVIAGVIFDMDGVLVDSEPIYHQATNDALSGFGHWLGSDEYYAWVGRSSRDFLEWLTGRFALGEQRHAVEEAIRLAVRRRFGEPLSPNPGVRELLGVLDAAGVLLAVGSSTGRSGVDRTLTALGLASRFACTVAGDEVAAAKPAPDIYLACAGQLALAPSTCVVIEDSPHGVEAARAAGMSVIGLRTPHVATLTGCLALVERLDECIELLGLAERHPHPNPSPIKGEGLERG